MSRETIKVFAEDVIKACGGKMTKHNVEAVRGYLINAHNEGYACGLANSIKRYIDDAVAEQLSETDYSGALRGIVQQRIDELFKNDDE